MSRPLRIEYEGAFYHVTARGNERRDVFFSDSDYGKFKGYLKEAREKHGVVIHCFVLMTNHYHLLIETPRGNLSRAMHFLNVAYTNHINRKLQRSGHLFQGRYKAILVDRDSYLLELSRYLHLNPVRAAMVSTPEEYPHSSYSSYVSGKDDGLTAKELILSMLSAHPGEAVERYRHFVHSMIGGETASPLDKAHGGAILGGESFVKETLNRTTLAPALEKGEIANRRVLLSIWKLDEVMDAVCADLKVTRLALTQSRGLCRNTAIYLLKRHTGLTNRQIAELFKVPSPSAVRRHMRDFRQHWIGMEPPANGWKPSPQNCPMSRPDTVMRTCQSGRIRKRLLLATSFRRSY